MSSNMAARKPERRPSWVAIPFFYHQIQGFSADFPPIQWHEDHCSWRSFLWCWIWFTWSSCLSSELWHALAPCTGRMVSRNGGFHRWGHPTNGWFILENPTIKWMIWGYSYFKKPPKRSPTCQMHRSLYKTTVPTVRSMFQISSILWGYHGSSADEVSATWAKFQVSEMLSFTQMLQMDEKPKLRLWRMNQQHYKVPMHLRKLLVCIYISDSEILSHKILSWELVGNTRGYNQHCDI